MTGCGIKTGITPRVQTPSSGSLRVLDKAPETAFRALASKNGGKSELREIFFDHPPGASCPPMSRQERT